MRGLALLQGVIVSIHIKDVHLNRLFLYILAVLFSAISFASENPQNIEPHSIYSSALEEQRDYFVYLPPSYRDSEQKFPVLYVLDGDIHRWKSISGVVEGLSTETLEQQIQQAIVVSIPNTDRERDLTPSKVHEWTFKGKVLDTFKQSGNANEFLKFLVQELIPHINDVYNTNNDRVLVGESFGGLFASYALMHHPSSFSSYLIIDPTSIWDNNYLNRQFEELSFENSKPSAKVFFAFANNSKLGDIGITNKQWGQIFASKLESMNSEEFSVKQQYFDGETHGTVAFLGWYHGLKFLLANTEE